MTAAVAGQDMSVLGHAITNAMSEGKPEAIPARIGDACFMDLTPIAQGGSQLQQSDLVSKINCLLGDYQTIHRTMGNDMEDALTIVNNSIESINNLESINEN